MFKCLNGLSSSLSASLPTMHLCNQTNLRSTTSMNLIPTKPKTSAFKNSLTCRYSGVTLWNRLPVDVKKSKNVNVFQEKDGNVSHVEICLS